MLLHTETLSDEELISKIRSSSQKYWSSESDSEISDIEYDSLLRELEKRNPSHPLLSEVASPGVAGTGEKIHHAVPMLSLDKAYSLEEVLSWAEKYKRSDDELLLVQPKYDGISALWENRILSTRGDGHDGENITDKLPLIELESPSGKGNLSSFSGRKILGEIVIREDDFRDLYSKITNRNGKLYKNPRNAVAGIMGLKEISDMLRQGAKLTLVDYDLHSEKVKLSELAQNWESLEKRLKNLPYPMDGIVLKLADTAYAESLGSTVHHPRGQIAFKFTAEKHLSILRKVLWSAGKNSLTPVAEFDPVEIGGATIRNATLHNLQNVLEKDIQIGDVVEIQRAGEVIPYIASSTPGENRTPCIIDTCPSCGSRLVRELPELCCVNPDCPDRRLQLLLAAIRVLEIDGLGEANVRNLIATHHVRSVGDLFRLGELEFQQIPGFKAVSAKKLYRQIQNARKSPDWKLLSALNIRGIGPNIAKAILEKISLQDLRNADEKALSAIPGIGPERANLIRREITVRADELDTLLSARESEEPDGDLFSGFF